MDDELKETIKGFVWLGILVGGTVGATYVSFKVLAAMTGKAVAAELLKKGAVLVAPVL